MKVCGTRRNRYPRHLTAVAEPFLAAGRIRFLLLKKLTPIVPWGVGGAFSTRHQPLLT